MRKSLWAFILILTLVLLGSEKVAAQLFSSKIEGDTGSLVLFPADTIQVAQVIPEPGGPVV